MGYKPIYVGGLRITDEALYLPVECKVMFQGARTQIYCGVCGVELHDGFFNPPSSYYCATHGRLIAAEPIALPGQADADPTGHPGRPPQADADRPQDAPLDVDAADEWGRDK